ncbi:hypothetical protein DM860_000833 [Cuscuta australis]|uniref:F-box domain-containing protein n=1 Tax=Cuscuta australis TaxID=267555 RepID=A0A328D1A6_9ASTE|nr:hypothetical protein DM860_000833 [Cuscuta australis]
MPRSERSIFGVYKEFQSLHGLGLREANQLKLVCRRWNSLISSPCFITFFNHRRHRDSSSSSSSSPSSSSSYSLVYRLRNKTRLFRYRYTGRGTAQFDATRVLDLGFLPVSPSKRILVRCSCADLILCSNKNKKKTRVYFYVCNPLTRQWAALPPASAGDGEPSPAGEAVGLLSVPSPCSLCSCEDHPHRGGDDNSRHKFTVVRIPKCSPGSPVSEEGRWRSCAVRTPRALPCRGDALTGLVAYRGMLHWLLDGHILDRLRVTTVWRRDHYVWELEDYDAGKWSLAHKIHARNRYSCVPEDLVYVTGSTNNRQSSREEDAWFSKFRAESLRHYTSFGGDDDDIHPKIASQWWPTPISPPPVKGRRRCTQTTKSLKDFFHHVPGNPLDRPWMMVVWLGTKEDEVTESRRRPDREIRLFEVSPNRSQWVSYLLKPHRSSPPLLPPKKPSLSLSLFTSLQSQLFEAVAELQEILDLQDAKQRISQEIQSKDSKVLAFARKLQEAVRVLDMLVDDYSHYRRPKRAKLSDDEDSSLTTVNTQIKLSDILSYAHRISYTTFAPPEFGAGPGPLRGALPPAPREEHMRASQLYNFADHDVGLPKTDEGNKEKIVDPLIDPAMELPDLSAREFVVLKVLFESVIPVLCQSRIYQCSNIIQQ